MALKNLFSLSSLATALTALYLYVAVKNLSRLMFPLQGIDISAYGPAQLVKPLWDAGGGDNVMGMKVYLSTRERFTLDFLKSEYGDDGEGELGRMDGDSVLLWEAEDATVASLARSFLLSSECGEDDKTCAAGEASKSFQYASKWLDDAEEKHALEAGSAGVVTAMSHAGEGIESTSVLLVIYNAVSNGIGRIVSAVKGTGEDDDDALKKKKDYSKATRVVVPISPKSPIWQSLLSNSTVHVHVLLSRHPHTKVPPADLEEAAQRLRKSFQTHSTLLGHVSMIKYDAPHHITKPRRVLYHDLTYIIRRYVFFGAEDEPKPWDTSVSSPEQHQIYEDALEMKRGGVGYPYWKPEVAVKFVGDDLAYPSDLVMSSGMEVVQLRGRTPGHESGYAYLPGLHVDEIGLTSEKYVALNETVTALPLRITFDRNDIEAEDGVRGGGGGVAQGGLSPARWRLLSHFSQALESQQQMGFDQSDIDDLRRLIAETNVTLLGITILASTLHLLFEFLTFKNDVEFWRGNKDLTGLSVRALFMDFVSQFIILLYLIEMDSSLLMTVPSGIGVLIALWKCQRGSGLKFVKVKANDADDKASVAFYNRLFRITGYELSATRLKVAPKTEEVKKGKDKRSGFSQKADEVDLVAISIETDKIATRTLGKYFLFPVVLGYTMHSLFMEQHSGWYSWLITSASSAVYALGFVMMTPQLFLNYKLKSVAHLPWKVLGFRFINTFIDDLFAFIIRMPTMARISCFRDDVVFIIYLWQRYLYPVDTSRPIEGGGMDAISAAAATEASANAEDEKEKKRQ